MKLRDFQWRELIKHGPLCKALGISTLTAPAIKSEVVSTLTVLIHPRNKEDFLEVV